MSDEKDFRERVLAKDKTVNLDNIELKFNELWFFDIEELCAAQKRATKYL